jgi:acetolactate synthase-1/3 small subunit
MNDIKYIISVLVENKPGALTRVSGLFSSRGFNIESLSVAETIDPTVSRLTLVTHGNEQILEQITKQLNKLIDTIKVIDFGEGKDYVAREMALIKVNVNDETRSELLSMLEIFRGKVVDVSIDSYTVEITGDDNKIKAVLDLFKPLGIKEIARTGKAALLRGSKNKR